MYVFKNSLKQGHAGEVRLQAMYPWLVRTDGRREDFVMPTGDLLELKTESRSTAQTANIAAELNSSEGKPGAVERAVNDGIKYICFLYADNKLFMYNTAELLHHMYAYKHRTVLVPNQGYDTLIALIDREDIAHLEIDLAAFAPQDIA